jgi:hypothetical protein
MYYRKMNNFCGTIICCDADRSIEVNVANVHYR